MTVGTVYPGDRAMWEHLASGMQPAVFPDAPRALILPHHAMAARELGAAWAGIAAVRSPSVVYLVSPDHFGDGYGLPKVAASVAWDTVFGQLAADREAAADLVARGLARFDDSAFIAEHGVSIHAPYIKKWFPNARFVPIILGWRPPAARFDGLSDRLAAILAAGGDSVLLIASVDFSHYQSRTVADFHDESARLSIEGLLADDIRDREVDSPPSVRLTLRAMETLGAGKAERFLHTNSDDFLGAREARTTSHQFWAFYAGRAAATPSFSVLASGMLAGDAAALASRSAWSWDPEAAPPAASDPERFLRDLRGEEDRFFSGADLCLFGPPSSASESGLPDGVFEWIREGGSLRVLFLDDAMDTAALGPDRVSGARGGADFLVVVFRHSGAADLVPLMRSWVDAGADAVIGRGPSPPTLSWHAGKPCWSSLGAFAGGPGAQSGELAGLVFRAGRVDVFRIPVLSVDGYPRQDTSAESP